MKTVEETLSEVLVRLRERQTVTEEEIRKWEWENEIRPRLETTRLPNRFWPRVKTWNPKQKEQFDRCQSMCVGRGAIIALLGLRGVGKTTIAAEIIHERVLNEDILPWHRLPPYRKMSDLISFFKPLYADFGSIDLERLTNRRNDFCRWHPLVVIDELHDCEDQKMKNRILTDILDRRYAFQVDTIVISNQTPAEFQDTTSDSVLSRLCEHGQIIHCKWKSFRSKTT